MASRSPQTVPSPTPGPAEGFSQSPILQGGAGPLNGLNAQFVLDDGSLYMISSRHRPAPSTQASEPSRSQGGRASSSQPLALGTWQIIASRTIEGRVSWYIGEYHGEELKALMHKIAQATWSAFEQACLTAWKANDLTVGVLKKDLLPDGSWAHLQLMLGTESTAKPLRLKLRRAEDQEALVLATYLCAEMSRSNAVLRDIVENYQAKLDHSRRLAGVAPPPPSQVSTSLVNPGRVRRKREDDEGFEDEDDEDADETDEEGELLVPPGAAAGGS